MFPLLEHRHISAIVPKKNSVVKIITVVVSLQQTYFGDIVVVVYVVV